MSTPPFSGLTCVIPTHNRNGFLRRQLEYISRVREFPQVLIIDSSGAEHAETNRRVVAEQAMSNVEYRHDPAPFFEKLTRGLESITTPFVVLCADDDTLAPAGVQVCLNALKSDVSLSAVMGRCYILNTRTDQLSIARGYSLVDPDPLVRMRFYVNNWFSNYYAIHRRERLIEQLRLGWEVVDPKRSRLLNELLDSMLVLCDGGLKFIDVDYLMYQIHDDNLSKNTVAIENPQECDLLVASVGKAIAQYMINLGRATRSNGSGDPSVPVRKILMNYMKTQRIPGRRRSRIGRIERELQKLGRRLWGVQVAGGRLEKQDLLSSESSLRDAELQIGYRLSKLNPAGLNSIETSHSKSNSIAA